MKLTISYRETWLHRANPSFKLLLSCGLLVVIVFIHRVDITLYLTVLLIAALFTATGHPTRRLLLYTSPFAIIFLSSMSTMTLFGVGQTPWFTYGPVHVTEEGFYRGLNIGLRALSFSAAGLLFALTTRPVYLFYSLMQQAKLPPKYAYSFMAAVRLVPIMLEELQTLRYALQVRGFERRGLAGVWEKLKRYSVPMLAQSIRRAQRVAVAMEAKRFQAARKRTYFYKIGFGRADIVLTIALGALLALGWWAGVALPIFGVADVRAFG